MREFLRKDGRDSWIYEPTRGVTCLLKYAWPLNFFFPFLKPCTQKERSKVDFFLGFVRKTANEFKVIWENEAFKLNHKTYRVNFWCSKKTSTNFHVRTNSLLKTNSVLCSREWLKFKKIKNKKNKKNKKKQKCKIYKYTNKKAKKWLLAVGIFIYRKLKMLL